jgi:hypothetical protein
MVVVRFGCDRMVVVRFGCDGMVFVFISDSKINAYHHYSWKFYFRSL